jgi:glycosyltransferase involved in cell wall biosynthesis
MASAISLAAGGKSWPLISVVTCSYNQADFIEQTIRSVLDQGYPALEYIVIDGGSTDGSVEIIERYSDRLSYWISEADSGQTDALIKGFRRATGEITCWLCSDDLHEAWTLREVAGFFGANPRAEVVYGDATWIDANGSRIREKREHDYNRFIWMFDHNYIPQPSTFWRSNLYHSVGGLDPSFDLAMDADLWARFAERTEIHHARRPWSRMRLYPQQKTIAARTRSLAEARAIRRRYVRIDQAWVRLGLFPIAKAARIWRKLVM